MEIYSNFRYRMKYKKYANFAKILANKRVVTKM